ncbi:MAG: sigma-70 family RNA polymerase sigma factor [bacterium]|nr:sigma-70 family RNA polymerase sigma factor [bacterium]
MVDRGLQTVYDEVAPDLYAYILRMSGNQADAEDVLQETFARLLGSGFTADDTLDYSRYLFRIATNLMRDRRRWSRRWQFGKLPESAGRAPENGYLAGIDAHRAMADMKPKQRTLLWLAYVEGMSHKDIAEVMGVASTSVRVMLARARKKLLTRLGKEKS